jgi:hypothetical protein
MRLAEKLDWKGLIKWVVLCDSVDWNHVDQYNVTTEINILFQEQRIYWQASSLLASQEGYFSIGLLCEWFLSVISVCYDTTY